MSTEKPTLVRHTINSLLFLYYFSYCLVHYYFIFLITFVTLSSHLVFILSFSRQQILFHHKESMSSLPCIQPQGMDHDWATSVMAIVLFFAEIGASLGGSAVKNPPANAGHSETQVQSLGQEDPLEKEMAAHSHILAWEIPWTKVPGGYSPRGCKESDMT